MILGRLGSSILSNLCKHGTARWSMQLEPASYPISLHLRDIHHLIPQEVDGGDIHQPMAAPQSPYTFSSPIWDATAGTSQTSATNILASGVEPTQSVCLEAHSSLETLLMIFSPSQLAVQVGYMRSWYLSSAQGMQYACRHGSGINGISPSQQHTLSVKYVFN